MAPIDTNGDGLVDSCGPSSGRQSQQPQGSTLCNAGYEPRDQNGDGVYDVCVPSAPPPSGSCPQGFPYGKDTNFDGVIDTCYANPVG